MAVEMDPVSQNVLGLIVLSTDETLENEARALFADKPVRLHHSRIFSADDVTPASLTDMRMRIAESTSLLPESVCAVGYACTSASVVIGPDAVEEQVRAGRPGVAVTNPISAVIAALESLGARRIGLVTPYPAEVVAPICSHLARHDTEVLREVSFGEADDRRVARISEKATVEAARQVAEGVDAIFLSCTNLQTLNIIDALEAELDVPVLSSNLALLWHLLRISGIEASGWGPGRLFQSEDALAKTA